MRTTTVTWKIRSNHQPTQVFVDFNWICTRHLSIRDRSTYILDAHRNIKSYTLKYKQLSVVKD